MTTHTVETEYNAGMQFTSKSNGHKIIMDSPQEGEMGTGVSPKKLMLASLAGCTGIDVVSILQKMRTPFSEFSIEITGTLSETHPKTYTHVNLIYTIKLADADRSKMEKAVNLSEVTYCGVMAMFKTFATVETRIIYL